MDRFPPLGTALVSLPMADHVAVGLCDALLIDAPDRRSRALRELLRYDPPLLLWSILRSDRWRATQPDEFDEVADWLSGELLDVLHWPESVLVEEPGAVDPSLVIHFAKLAGDCVAYAHAAPASPSTEASVVRRLLSGADAWFQNEDAALPAWLNDLEAPQLNAVDDNAREVGLAIERQWTSSPLGGRGGAMLRHLVERLRRLRDLEAGFSTALEREKLDSLKELAYGASHEINNPLANISTRAQTLLRDETDPERRKKLATINSQAFRAHEMIADMMLFARPPRIEPAEVRLRDVVTDVLQELAPDAAEQGTRLIFASDGEPHDRFTLTADGGQLRAALKSVVQNSLEAIGGGGRVEVSLAGASSTNGHALSDGDEVCRIVVSDTGPGIPPEVRRHMFDPFYSGREAGRGLGFGLSKSWRIITAHGGRIEVESEPGRGATIALCLPRQQG